MSVGQGTGRLRFAVELHDQEAVRRLSGLVARLRESKTNGLQLEETNWNSFFSDAQLKTFWWPTKEEHLQALEKWRQSQDEPDYDWILDSAIEAVLQANYELFPLQFRQDGKVLVEAHPFSWPHGGTDALIRLLEAFGDVEEI